MRVLRSPNSVEINKELFHPVKKWLQNYYKKSCIREVDTALILYFWSLLQQTKKRAHPWRALKRGFFLLIT
jgi:hypothetical protein